MADPTRSLEEIKASLQHVSLDTNGIKEALRDLCDHLIAQKAEIDANKAQQKNFQASVPTRGQIEAMRGR